MPDAAMTRRLAQRIRHGEAGFTLSEMLVVLVIMSIVIAALVSVLAMSITQNTQIQEQSTLQTEVRSVVENMARELRQAYSGDTTYPILTATTHVARSSSRRTGRRRSTTGISPTGSRQARSTGR